MHNWAQKSIFKAKYGLIGKMLIYPAFLILAIVFFFFSYLWTDFSIIQMLSQTKPEFLSVLSYIKFGDAHRDFFAVFYLILTLILFLFQLYLLKKPKINLTKKHWLIIFLAILTFSFSYPFLSRDIFNYMITAKIIWFYHQNPYLVAPNQFSNDLWLGFNHNIDNKYSYPPVFLGYSLIPMVLFGGSKFLLNFFGLKFLNALIFFLAGHALIRLTKQPNLILGLWFFNPLLIVELLINAHNDLLMVCLFIFSIYLIKIRKPIFGLLTFIASFLTKYFSGAGYLAVFTLIKKPKLTELSFKFLSIFTILFLIFFGNNYWYYSWLFMFLPFITLRTSSWAMVYLILFIILSRYFYFIYDGYWTTNFLLNMTGLIIFLIFTLIIFNEIKPLRKLLTR